jgi:hypothetical protein
MYKERTPLCSVVLRPKTNTFVLSVMNNSDRLRHIVSFVKYLTKVYNEIQSHCQA